MNYVIAISLLFEPVGWPIPEPLTTAECRAIRAVCIEQEWLDPREAGNYLNIPDMQQNDMDILRKRVVDLRDAPRVADAGMFPSQEYCQQQLQFNSRYQSWLGKYVLWNEDKRGEIARIQAETSELYRIYDCVRDAQLEWYYLSMRRKKLKELRDLIGEENYYQGILPPPVPLWRFIDD